MDMERLSQNLAPLEAADEVSESLDKMLAILTHDNMEMILYEAKLLKIDTVDGLEKCVEVIFEHATSSDSQSLFAILCTKLMLSSVQISPESHKMVTFKEQITRKATMEVQNFLERQTLIKRGQADNESETSCLKKLRKPTALFRFVGELYLVDLIPATFVRDCLPSMLDEVFCTESSLETFCALMKVAGKKLEVVDGNDLSEEFATLVERKTSTLISPHTRFMVEELLEMRNIRWEPVSEVDWIALYNLFLCDVEEKLYAVELWYGK